MTDEQLISRKLNSCDELIEYLTYNVAAEIDWKNIAAKCVGHDNAYCLKLIKSKTWTDKNESSGSWQQILNKDIRFFIIYDTLCYGINSNELYIPDNTIYILTRDDNAVSNFLTDTIDTMLDTYREYLALCGIRTQDINSAGLRKIKHKHPFVLAFNSLVNMNDSSLYDENIIAIYRNTFVTSETIAKDKEAIQVIVMIWEYLIHDTISDIQINPINLPSV